MSQTNKRLVLISLLFNVYWLTCVVLQGYALIFALALLVLACMFDKTVWRVAPVIALLGIVGDTALTAFGVFSFDEQALGIGQRLASFPLWLAVLWFGFACYAWLMRSLVFKHAGLILISLCAVSGASSYYAGFQIGAVNFSFGLFPTLMLLLLMWGFYGWLFAVLIRFFSQKVLKESVDGTHVSHKPSLSVDIRY